MTEKDNRRAIKNIIGDFCQNIMGDQSAPYRHFIMDMVQGIMSTKSTCLSTIADIEESTSKKSSKVRRLSRNLNKRDIQNDIKKTEWNYYNTITDDKLYIFLDKSDIVNVHQQHTKGNYWIVDGSNDYKQAKGFDTSNFLCKGIQGQPIFLASIINDREKCTQKEEEKIIIQELGIHFKNKEIIYVGDSGYSNAPTMQFFIDNGYHFIFRLNIVKGKRKFICNGNEYSSSELIDLQKKLTHKKFFSKHKKKYGMATISKVQGTVTGLDDTFTFIIITFDNGSEPMILITDLECPNLDCAIKYYEKYMERWTIEDAFNDIKQSYNLEEYTVKNIHSLQNINQCVRLVYNLISLFLIEQHKHLKEYILSKSNDIRENVKKQLKRIAKGLCVIFGKYHSSFFKYKYG